MALVEGGEFICYIHDFKTASIDEWNSHCFGNDEHTEQGSTACVICGEIIEFENLPFHKLSPSGSKNIQLKCDDCDVATRGKVKTSKKELKTKK
jgi:Fe2+ or Zn2+ uptake regulation protein